MKVALVLILYGALSMGCSAGSGTGDDAEPAASATTTPATCTVGMTTDEIIATTAMADFTLSATQTVAVTGDLVYQLVIKIYTVAKQIAKGSGKEEIEDTWSFAKGVYSSTTGGDRAKTIEVRFYWGQDLETHKTDDLITDNIFTTDNYVVGSSASASISPVGLKISFASLGPLAPLVGIASTETSPMTIKSVDYLTDMQKRMRDVQFEITEIVTIDSSARSLNLSVTTPRIRIGDLSKLSALELMLTAGSGAWSARGQTLKITESTLSSALLSLAAHGDLKFQTRGDAKFDYDGTIAYGKTGTLEPTLSLTCTDGTAIDRSIIRVNQEANSQLDAVATQFGSTVVKCGSASKVPDCMSEATLQQVKTGAANLDVAFVFDVSGSMGDDIRQVKKKTKTVAEAIKAKVADSRFGLVVFSDSVDAYTMKVIADLTADVDAFQASVDSVKLLGGGDFPEAALEGTMEALEKLQWRSAADIRVAVVITDATFKDPGPNGVTLAQVIAKAKAKQIVVVPVILGF